MSDCDSIGERIKPRLERRMAVIDKLSPETRALVHEIGWAIVKQFRDHGVTDPKTIRHLVHMVQNEMNNPGIEQ